MSRLIRESDVQDMLDDAQCISDGEYSYVCTEDIKLSKLPTVDAVQVTRCIDCKQSTKVDGMIGLVWCDKLARVGTWVENDFFCADGERRDDGR